MSDEFGVYAKGRFAGKLQRSRSGGRFVYDERWDGPDIAYRLKVQQEPHETSHIPSLPPFFVNLLPEGTILRSLSRRAKVAESDLVGLLGILGEDAVGM